VTASPNRTLVKIDSATRFLSKARATAIPRRDARADASGCIARIAARQFVLNGRKMDTRLRAREGACGLKKKGRLRRQPERRYCGEKDVIAMGEISRQS